VARVPTPTMCTMRSARKLQHAQHCHALLAALAAVRLAERRAAHVANAGIEQKDDSLETTVSMETTSTRVARSEARACMMCVPALVCSRVQRLALRSRRARARGMASARPRSATVASRLRPRCARRVAVTLSAAITRGHIMGRARISAHRRHVCFPHHAGEAACRCSCQHSTRLSTPPPRSVKGAAMARSTRFSTQPPPRWWRSSS
jgi:hypothetical protein